MPTISSSNEIRSDFDAIATLMPRRDRLGPHEAWLLRQLPTRRGTAIEIGCGVGNVARRLAGAFDDVVAIDLSPGMIDEAKRRFRITKSWKLRRAYWRHGRNETYLMIGEVERIARQELPGATVRAHLLWRYSIVWDKIT